MGRFLALHILNTVRENSLHARVMLLLQKRSGCNLILKEKVSQECRYHLRDVRYLISNRNSAEQMWHAEAFAYGPEY